MATVYWDGSTDTDWATAANWTPAATPNADDTVIFDARQTTKPTTGMTDGGSADDSGHADNATLDLLHFKKDYTGGIGTAALPLTTSPDTVIIEGTGTYYICCGVTDQSTDTTIGEVIINNPSANVILFSNANDGANVCEFTKVHLIAGTLTIDFYEADTDNTGCYVADLWIAPRNNKATNATVVIDKDAFDALTSTAMNIYMNNGTLTTDSQVGTFVMRGGTVNYGTDLTTQETDLNITELRQYGGIFKWYPDDSGGDAFIGDLWLFGGTFISNDDPFTTVINVPRVLGGGAGNDIRMFQGSVMRLNNGMGNITLAAGSQFWNHGGELTVDDNTLVTLTYDSP